LCCRRPLLRSKRNGRSCYSSERNEEQETNALVHIWIPYGRAMNCNKLD
jgi:hypothetical protein